MSNNSYLILNFRNAKLFRKFNKENVNIKCKDFVFDPRTGAHESRNTMPAFIEPITVHQISNMLHVLFNERPVPSFRKSFYGKNSHYFQMAENSYLKINTPEISKNGYYYETLLVKKAVWNAWNKVTANWELVKKYTDDENKFKQLVEKLDEILGINSRSLPFVVIREMVQGISREKRLELYKFITDSKDITGLVDYFGKCNPQGGFNKGDDSKITCKTDKTARLVNNGIETYANLSGQILVPVSDEDIKVLRSRSKGCATILDGGLVWIDSIKDENNISDYGFTKVKDISTEKTLPFLKPNVI